MMKAHASDVICILLLYNNSDNKAGRAEISLQY